MTETKGDTTKPTAAAAADTSAADLKRPAPQTNPLLVASYITIVVVWTGCQVIFIPYVANLLTLVTAILYVACHWSLGLREQPQTGDNQNGEGASSTAIPMETMSQQDAYQFPLVGSLSLFSLYLAFKFLEKDLVNLIIGGYFCLVGALALTATFGPLILAMMGGKSEFLEREFKWGKKINHPKALEIVLGPSPFEIDIEFQTLDVFAIVPAAIFVYFYFMTKHWTLNNVLGICFCIQGIQRFSLGTYKIGAILLVGLFFYDIFWVFGTDVMVTVAKNLDGPIKILFPRSLTPNEETGKLDLSLLGLGDIVIPGFFLALLLRFDAHKANIPTNYTDVHASFPKPYFHSALIFYVLGMATTMGVMIFFNAAQPALLYLVPACLISSLGCATLRGELSELLEYSEEQEEEDNEAKDEKEKKDN